MRRVYVITHPEATYHVENRVGGWYDSDLTYLGHAQAEKIAARIRALIPPDAAPEVFASDLRRTVQTARPIAELLGVEPELLPDLQEKSYGVAGGRPQALARRALHPAPGHGRQGLVDVGRCGADR